jgi:hypothetical protein
VSKTSVIVSLLLAIAGLGHAQTSSADESAHRSELQLVGGTGWGEALIGSPSPIGGAEAPFRLNRVVALNYLASDDAHFELIPRYLNAMRAQKVDRQAVEMEVTIEAKLPKLNRQATLRTLRSTSPTGKITYETLDAWGDAMLRREVIARYLAVESQQGPREDIEIAPSHYRFRFLRRFEDPGRSIHVFQLTPRQKLPGLFKGELWLDGETGLPVHESGQFVKSPSMFIKRIVFTRDYEMRSGWSVPVHIHSIIESRIAGRAELDIRFIDAGACRPTEVTVC